MLKKICSVFEAEKSFDVNRKINASAKILKRFIVTSYDKNAKQLMIFNET